MHSRRDRDRQGERRVRRCAPRERIAGYAPQRLARSRESENETGKANGSGSAADRRCDADKGLIDVEAAFRFCVQIRMSVDAEPGFRFAAFASRARRADTFASSALTPSARNTPWTRSTTSADDSFASLAERIP